MNIKTFVFLDCETTGLPAFEYNKTKITELCLISCHADNIRLGVIPRVKNKLNLCFNPLKRVSPGSEEITGLYNDDLVNESSFNEVSLNIITNFLRRLSKPICFVAHNGFKFDYPILRNHIEFVGNEFPEDIYCIDSLCAFRQIHNESIKRLESKISEELIDDWDDVLCNELTKIEDSLAKTPPRESLLQQLINETTPPVRKQCDVPQAPKNKKKQESSVSSPGTSRTDCPARRRLNFYPNEPTVKKNVSFKLSNVYERIVQKEAKNAHEAEADVNMLIEIVLHLGDQFVDYANENLILFNCIPKMEPGKKIGLPNL